MHEKISLYINYWQTINIIKKVQASNSCMYPFQLTIDYFIRAIQLCSVQLLHVIIDMQLM